MALAKKSAETVISIPVWFAGATARETGARLRQSRASAQRLILDFAETDSIDGAAIGTLVILIKETRQSGDRLILRNLNSAITELFAETGLDLIFDIESSGRVCRAQKDLFEKIVETRLDISAAQRGDIKILKLGGIMSHPSGARYFKQQTLLAMAGARKILLDLQNLTFFDSLSISVLLTMHRLLSNTGGAMRLCAANALVRELFMHLNLDKAMPIFDDCDAACRDWD